MSAPFDIIATTDGAAMFHPDLSGGGGSPAPPPIQGSASMNDSPVGTGDLTGAHNTPLHLGSLVVMAVVVVVALQVLGFRFVVSAGIGS